MLALCVGSVGCRFETEQPSLAVETPTAALRTTLLERLSEAARQGFSGAVVITLENEILLAQGYGLADREQGLPNTADTAFDFGSVMKELTAAAIYQLAAAGELFTTDSIGTVFENVPADKSGITLLHLLRHRSGLQEYHDTSGDFEPLTREQARQRIFTQMLLFEPGSSESYSNAGYTLLADLIEEVSGQHFTDYIHDALFEAAEMEASGFFGEAVWQHVETAIGYGADVYEANDPASWPSTWSLVGNGGLVTTPMDLNRWFSALWRGRILSEAALMLYEREYLAPNSAQLAGHTVYAYAGAGDFGLGGVALDVADADTRVIIGTNAYEDFPVEDLAVELLTQVLSER